jgi:hypothetical protein
MAISCRNCGGYFTLEELRQRKPPVHAWPLTETGAKMLAANEADGVEHKRCPNCGCMTLRM